MATTSFQLLDPQDALIVGHLSLKSDVTAPVNGMAVKISSGVLVTATDHVSTGILCEIARRGVNAWNLYDLSDANDLTHWKGKPVGLLLRGVVRLPVASVSGSVAEGAKVETVSGGTYAVTAATVGVGTVIAASVVDQYGTECVDIAFDFTAGAVPT